MRAGLCHSSSRFAPARQSVLRQEAPRPVTQATGPTCNPGSGSDSGKCRKERGFAPREKCIRPGQRCTAALEERVRPGQRCAAALEERVRPRQRCTAALEQRVRPRQRCAAALEKCVSSTENCAAAFDECICPKQRCAAAREKSVSPTEQRPAPRETCASPRRGAGRYFGEVRFFQDSAARLRWRDAFLVRRNAGPTPMSLRLFIADVLVLFGMSVLVAAI